MAVNQLGALKGSGLAPQPRYPALDGGSDKSACWNEPPCPVTPKSRRSSAKLTHGNESMATPPNSNSEAAKLRNSGARLLLITQLPPPTGGIATWSDRYIRHCHVAKIPLLVVNNAVMGARAMNLHSKKSAIVEVARTVLTLWRTASAVLLFRPSLVHLNTTCSPHGIVRDWLCMQVIPRRTPIILHCRANIRDQLGDAKLGTAVFTRAARRATKVLVLNDASREFVERTVGAEPQTIPNFIDAGAIVASPRGERTNIRTIAFAGHLEPTKGVDELLTVAQQRPDLQFTLAGAQSSDIYAKTRPPNVALLGNIDHHALIRLLDSADVFLFPTYTEGFSNSLLEAMARGLPVIATDVGANKAMLENCGGIIVPPRDAASILRALDAMSEPDTRSRMSQWNVEKVLHNYTVEGVAAELFSLYREAMEGPHGRGTAGCS